MSEHRSAVVIEDDDDIRDLLESLLRQSGFTVHATGYGLDGVELVRDHDPHIVTLDIGLPDIDGLEVIRRVRGITDAYVVMLTARTEEVDVLVGLDAGADDYLGKPFRPRELRARIEAMFRRPRGAHQTAPLLTSIPGSRPAPTGPFAPVRPAFASAPVRALALAGSVPASAPYAAPPAPTPTAHGQPTSGSPAASLPAGAAWPSRATAGPAVSAPRTLELNGLMLIPELHQVSVPDDKAADDQREVALTPTEFLLLQSLLEGGRRVRSKTEFSRLLRGDDPLGGTYVSSADQRTVEVHMGNLRRKLRDDARSPRWVETVRGVGYRCAAPA